MFPTETNWTIVGIITHRLSVLARGVRIDEDGNTNADEQIYIQEPGIGYGYGVAQGKRASQGRDLGVDKRFGAFTLGSTVVAL